MARKITNILFVAALLADITFGLMGGAVQDRNLNLTTANASVTTLEGSTSAYGSADGTDSAPMSENYIYISIAHGQAMGQTHGRDTYYIGYDGYIQKIKEDYGTPDSVSEFIDANLDRKKTNDLFVTLRSAIDHTAFKASEMQKDGNDNKLTEYFGPSAEIEWYALHSVRRIETTDIQSVRPLVGILGESLRREELTKRDGQRFLRAHEITDQKIVSTYRKERLIFVLDVKVTPDVNSGRETFSCRCLPLIESSLILDRR